MGTEALQLTTPTAHARTDDLPWTDILGVRISAIDMPTAVATIEGWIESGHRDYACFCNVHSIMEADKDPDFKDVLNNAGLRCPDGMPLVWLSRRYGNPHVQHVRGADLMLELCNRSQVTGHRHYFYGGAPGVAERLVDRLNRLCPGLQVAGWHTPQRVAAGEREQPQVIAAINASRPDIVWVGLGCPKQELWAANHHRLLEGSIVLAVGAAFDFHSGTIRQAPEWMQRSGIEWTYRLSQDPARLWRRYLEGNSSFLMRVLGIK